MEDQPSLQEQDAPLSPPESEPTVATEDLPDTADWIALRKRHHSSQLHDDDDQSLPLPSSLFDSQETVLTEDLPTTNDWLRLRQSRGVHRKSNSGTSLTTTLKESQVKVSSPPPEATTNAATTKMAPSKVTPPSQNISEQHAKVLEPKTPDRGEAESDSEETTWSVDKDHCREQIQNFNPTTTTGHSSNDILNAKHHPKSPVSGPWKSDPVSPLTQEHHTHRDQIQIVIPTATDHSSDAKHHLNIPASGPWKSGPVSPLTQDHTQRSQSNGNRLHAKQHGSPVSEPWKSDPVSPLTQEHTQRSQMKNANRSAIVHSSNNILNAKQHHNSPVSDPWKSGPVSPLTQEHTQRSQIKNANSTAADHFSNNILNHHHSPVSVTWKSDPVSPLTQEYTQRRRNQSNWKHHTHQHTLHGPADETETVSSPLLFTRKRLVLPLPQSPSANDTSVDPLFAPKSTKKPPSTIVSQKKKKKMMMKKPQPTQNNCDSDATPSPPLKRQPWFQKKTKKRKLQQMRLKFG